jgi:uncharacterized protein (DUF924 family)
MQPNDIIDFWFNELESQAWFAKDDDLDNNIKERFSEIHKKASCGELIEWRQTPEGRLAEIIILDQFSRNMFRGTAETFAYDTLALVLAEEAVSLQADKQLTTQQKIFLYMPYMHSESKKVHEVAMTLYSQSGLEQNFEYEKMHKDIIDRFGRYPHRNDLLKRNSTPEELEFLKGSNSSF